jgi:hypothetical protein
MKEIKILGLCTDNAQAFHRVELPLKNLHGRTLNIGGENCTIKCDIKKCPVTDILFTEDDVINYDILWYNWQCHNDASFLSGICAKYNTLVVYDLDDAMNLPENHILRKSNLEGAIHTPYKIVQSVVNADMTLTTNDYLLQDILPFTSFAGVSENFLPIGEGQFVNKSEENSYKSGQKINIAIMGSTSHINDWASIRNIWDRISSDYEIRTKCKLSIIGYLKGDPIWEQVRNIFSVNNFEINLVEGKPVYEYMNLLNDVDIMLAPLENNDFNHKKSGLKLIECAIKGIPVVSTDVYASKEFNAFICCPKSSDWYKTIKQLIKQVDGEYEFQRLGKILSEENIKKNNFDFRIEKIQKGIEYILNHDYQLAENLHIFGITYSPEQFTEYERVDNSGFNSLEKKSWRFEYNYIIDEFFTTIYDGQDYENQFYGAFSWKFLQKTGRSKKVVDKLFRQSKDFDVLNFSINVWEDTNSYLRFSEKAHPGLTSILNKCLINLGKENVIPRSTIYSNFFIMNGKNWEKYISEWLIPSINFMEKELWEEVNKDANYTGLSKEDLKKYTGMEYYNLLTFVCERLILYYIGDEKLKVVNF